MIIKRKVLAHRHGEVFNSKARRIKEKDSQVNPVQANGKEEILDEREK